MIQVNILELALHDPSRLTTDLAGRTRLAANSPHALRRAHRLIRRRRPTTEHRFARSRPTMSLVGSVEDAAYIKGCADGLLDGIGGAWWASARGNIPRAREHVPPQVRARRS